MAKCISIVVENNFENWSKTRTACRGLIIREGKILLTYETKNDGQYMIPGGGLEDGETDTECLKREIAEETGLLVGPFECVLEIDEYYEEWKQTLHCFLKCGAQVTKSHKTKLNWKNSPFQQIQALSSNLSILQKNYKCNRHYFSGKQSV